MPVATHHWSPDPFTVSRLRFEPLITQQDNGSATYEIGCEVYRESTGRRVHRATRELDSISDIEDRFDGFIQQTVDTACLMHEIEGDMEETLRNLTPDSDESISIMSQLLGDVRLHHTEEGYTIHIEAGVVKRPDGFEFAASGWLGSVDSDSVIVDVEETTVDSIDELASEVQEIHDQLSSARSDRIDAARRITGIVDSFEAPANN